MEYNSEINSFTGKYRFLSNFWEHHPFIAPMYSIDFDFTWKTNEHYFQASKVLYYRDFEEVCRAETANEAKRLGRTFIKKKTWDVIKYDVMLTGLRAKFANPELSDWLVKTGDAKLIEGNTWGDSIWGAVWTPGEGWVGKNWLGKLLELVREERKAQADLNA